MIHTLNTIKQSYRPAFGKANEPKNNNLNSASNNTITTPPEQNQDEVNLSVLAINDVHGKMTNMERIYSVSQHFDRSTPETTDTLKLSAGDFILGANFVSNRVANKFLNWIGVSANAVGNHELDVIPTKLAKLMDEANYSLLAINATVDESSPMYGKIGKSIIEERNGHKYGIIGIAPSDMTERVKLNDSVKEIKIDDFETTVKKVQDEIDRLKNEEGINKIIIISHSGLKNDKKLAEMTSGIDIIHSAHTHEHVRGITLGENLLYSKTGEPVVLTEYGKDGEYVGILNVTFDKDGVIKKVQNNSVKTSKFNRTLTARSAVESIVGKPEVIGEVSKTVEPPKNRLLEYNPHGGIIVDSMRSELGTDIAVLNAGNIRGYFKVGKIDTRLVNDVTPFEDKLIIGKLSEKELVDAIKVGGTSFGHSTNKPGILFFSGMKYTMSDKGELLSLTFIDKEGNEHPIDVNNPGTEPKYTVAMDDFFAMGGDNYLPTSENPDFVVQKLDFDKNKLACDYIRKLPKPFEITNDHRVEIVPSDNK